MHIPFIRINDVLPPSVLLIQVLEIVNQGGIGRSFRTTDISLDLTLEGLEGLA